MQSEGRNGAAPFYQQSTIDYQQTITDYTDSENDPTSLGYGVAGEERG